MNIIAVCVILQVDNCYFDHVRLSETNDSPKQMAFGDLTIELSRVDVLTASGSGIAFRTLCLDYYDQTGYKMILCSVNS